MFKAAIRNYFRIDGYSGIEHGFPAFADSIMKKDRDSRLFK